MATSTTHWTVKAIPTEDVRRLLELLFAPEVELSQDADTPSPPTCGLNAAFDRVDAHLRQFEAEGRVRAIIEAVAA